MKNLVSIQSLYRIIIISFRQTIYEDLIGLPVINIRRVPLSNMLNAFVKRAMDIFGALVALTLFSPVMLVITIIIKVTSPGPLIFKQERIGLQNKPFYMYKFRSMVVQDASKEKNGWTVKNDPRVTPVGKFYKKKQALTNYRS